MKNIAIIGCNHIFLHPSIVAEMHRDHGDIEVILLEDAADRMLAAMDKQEAVPLSYPDLEPFVLRNPYPMESPYGNRKFSCSGKHQYREMEEDGKTVWVCECGRKTTD